MPWQPQQAEVAGCDHATGYDQYLGTRGDWRQRLGDFQDGFRALEPDIVTLQETVLTDDVDQAAEMLGDGYYLAQQ